MSANNLILTGGTGGLVRYVANPQDMYDVTINQPHAYVYVKQGSATARASGLGRLAIQIPVERRNCIRAEYIFEER